MNAFSAEHDASSASIGGRAAISNDELTRLAVDRALRVMAYCRWHCIRYHANKRVGRHAEATDCPECIKERRWIRQAVAVHGQDMFDRDPDGVVWHAQKMAGYRFFRYRAAPPKDVP